MRLYHLSQPRDQIEWLGTCYNFDANLSLFIIHYSLATYLDVSKVSTISKLNPIIEPRGYTIKFQFPNVKPVKAPTFIGHPSTWDTNNLLFKIESLKVTNNYSNYIHCIIWKKKINTREFLFLHTAIYRPTNNREYRKTIITLCNHQQLDHEAEEVR